jgi:hypothetical protein
VLKGDGGAIKNYKLAKICSATFDIVAEASKNPELYADKNFGKNLSKIISDSLNENKKDNTTMFKTFKARFEKEGHIPMKKGGYELSKKFEAAIAGDDVKVEKEHKGKFQKLTEKSSLINSNDKVYGSGYGREYQTI